MSGTLTNGNYTVTQANNGNWVVNRKALVVQANNDTRAVSGSAYTGGNGVTYTGFVNAEDKGVLNGTLIYGGSAQGATRAGAYSISASGLAGDNYAIQFVEGRLLLTTTTSTPAAGELERPVRVAFADAAAIRTAQVQPDLLLTIQDNPVSEED